MLDNVSLYTRLYNNLNRCQELPVRGIIPPFLTMNEDWLRRKVDELEAENARLRDQLARAKNPEPVQRPSYERVRRLASNACMDVERLKNRGFMLTMGLKKRWFKKLTDLWEILTADEWELSEIFSKKVIPPIPKRNKPNRRNPSLVPNPNLPDRDSAAAENRTEVNQKKPTYEPAYDRVYPNKIFLAWWYINHEPPPPNPRNFWNEGSNFEQSVPFS